jgi:hypothetical protein
MNLDALDNVIAVVIVLLALSLVVQSIQSALKKLFKIKSLQLEQSLVDLFHYALNKDTLANLTSMTDRSPFLRTILPRTKHPAERDPQVETLFKGLALEFKKIGRVTQSGKLMLDSIAKEDVLKLMQKIPVANLANILPANSLTQLQGLAGQLTAQQANINSVTATFPEIKQDLETLQTEVGNLLQGGQFNSTVIAADVLKLQDDLKATRTKIEALIPKATPGSAQATALQALDTALGQLINAFNVFANIRDVLNNIGVWYETLMQSFEERYARSMRTWTLIICAVVVIVFNANFFNVYKNISTNEVLRNNILQTNDEVARRLKASAEQGNQPTTAGTVQQWYTETKTVISNDSQLVNSYGLNFAKPRETLNWLAGGPTGYGVDWLKKGLYVFAGLLFMMMLLSAGAPFWQDTLESLFGLKNFIRGSSGTKNVEDKSGKGQPKP